MRVELCALNGDEQTAAFDLPRVVRHIENLRRLVAAQLAASRARQCAECNAAFVIFLYRHLLDENFRIVLARDYSLSVPIRNQSCGQRADVKFTMPIAVS